VNIRPN